MDARSRTLKLKHFFTSTCKTISNLTAEANIIIQTKENTITIPSYLVDNDYVIVNNDEKRKVKIGLSDYQR
jgi:hypothetical protein